MLEVTSTTMGVVTLVFLLLMIVGLLMVLVYFALTYDKEPSPSSTQQKVGNKVADLSTEMGAFNVIRDSTAVNESIIEQQNNG